MSSNRLSDDINTYRRALGQSVDPLEYTMDTCKFEHAKRCRMKLGIVGGTAVSHIVGANLVDTESELRLQTRAATRCPSLLYDPYRDAPSERMKHLPTCQMVHYKGVPGATWAPPGPQAADMQQYYGLR